jgi:N-methylhydantoinase A
LKLGLESSEAFVGIDVGGTHTDVAVAVGPELRRGKALTTYDDFSRGALGAIGVAAGELGYSTEELLSRCQLAVCGTTVVTNVITEFRGARAGVLVTDGFRDTFRFAGGPGVGEVDDHLQTNVPDLVPPEAIREITGRIDYSGAELAPLDLASVERETRDLVETMGVETLAICFLWSFLNPEHELAAEERIKELYPDLFISVSHRLYRLRGETRRWTTAVMNSFVQPPAQTFLDTMGARLKESGLQGSLVFCQGMGGAISKERAGQFPLGLLGSGPAGGAIGSNALAKRIGSKDVLIADMGGTSFDVGVIIDNTPHIKKNFDIDRFKTGVGIVDVLSIGAGGGSIASVGERGMPEVGPHSASSTPGPACYGQGGTEPTVTDAMVLLGVIDPDNYLGGRMQLDIELARAAMQDKLGERFGWSAEESACAVHDLCVANMANAMREVTVKQGYDPRDFLFLAYGGTLPMFATQIAEALRIGEVVVPRNSSVFCAQGLLSSDFMVRNEQTVVWSIASPDGLEEINAVADALRNSTYEDMAGEGFAAEEVTISCSGDLRFVGQMQDLVVPMPARPLSREDLAQAEADFLKIYERVYGSGTAWRGSPIQLTNYTVTGTAPGVRVQPPPVAVEPADPGAIEKARRSVFLPSTRAWEEVPIYDGARFTPGTEVSGPCVIDEVDTTLFLPPGAVARRDELLSYCLTTNSRKV